MDIFRIFFSVSIDIEYLSIYLVRAVTMTVAGQLLFLYVVAVVAFFFRQST